MTLHCSVSGLQRLQLGRAFWDKKLHPLAPLHCSVRRFWRRNLFLFSLGRAFWDKKRHRLITLHYSVRRFWRRNLFLWSLGGAFWEKKHQPLLIYQVIMLHCSVTRLWRQNLLFLALGTTWKRKQCHLTALGLGDGTCCVELWVTHATEALLLSTPMFGKVWHLEAELLEKFFFFFGGGGEIGKKGRWAKATPKVRDAAWTTARQTGWNEWLPKFWRGLRIRSNVAANLSLFGKVWHWRDELLEKLCPPQTKNKTHWHPGNELKYRIRAWRGPRERVVEGWNPCGCALSEVLKLMLAYQQNSITQTTQNISNKT